MAKVIASSVRKGNVLDLDGKLAVVMHAENIHPGKGTPVTHLEMRRIADGVKIVERYRTTDQIERAYLDEKDSSSYKTAKLSNGARVMVPSHIGAGTRVVVMTADGSYVERAKD